MCKMYKRFSVHGLARNVGTVFYTFLGSGKSRNLTAYRKDSSLWQYFSNMRNFLTRNFSENWECYVLFESSVFAIKELLKMRNKNCRPDINNQKQQWKGVLNVEWKKLLDNTTQNGQFLIQVWNLTKANFFVGVFWLLYQHSIGRFCLLPEWFFKHQKQRPKGILQKKLFLNNFRIPRKPLLAESSFKVAECFKKETLAQVFLCKFHKFLRNFL